MQDKSRRALLAGLYIAGLDTATDALRSMREELLTGHPLPGNIRSAEQEALDELARIDSQIASFGDSTSAGDSTPSDN